MLKSATYFHLHFLLHFGLHYGSLERYNTSLRAARTSFCPLIVSKYCMETTCSSHTRKQSLMQKRFLVNEQFYFALLHPCSLYSPLVTLTVLKDKNDKLFVILDSSAVESTIRPCIVTTAGTFLVEEGPDESFHPCVLVIWNKLRDIILV